MYIKVCTLLVFLTGLVSSMKAQPVMQTATRSFTKNITCTPATLFSINAEKASMVITGWNNNYIQVRISFFAHHPDLSLATRELSYMQYALATDKDFVELRNIFKLPVSVDHIQSKLEIKMELMVPAKTRLQLTNKYGDINLLHLSGNIRMNLSFVDLRLTNIAAHIIVTAGYSDIRGNLNNTASVTCTDEKSKIALDLDGGGQYSFTSKHGDIDLSIKKISALTIKATRSDITIRPQDLNACRYKITSVDGALYLPGRYTGRLVKKGNQTSFTTTGSASLPLLAVNAAYNSVTIK